MEALTRERLSIDKVVRYYAEGRRDFSDTDLRGLNSRGYNLPGITIRGADLGDANITWLKLDEINGLGLAHFRNTRVTPEQLSLLLEIFELPKIRADDDQIKEMFILARKE
jgi:hypothetical protein